MKSLNNQNYHEAGKKARGITATISPMRGDTITTLNQYRWEQSLILTMERGLPHPNRHVSTDPDRGRWMKTKEGGREREREKLLEKTSHFWRLPILFQCAGPHRFCPFSLSHPLLNFPFLLEHTIFCFSFSLALSFTPHRTF